MKKRTAFIFYILFFSCVTASFSANPDQGSAFLLPQYSKVISLDFKDADIKDVLKVFSKKIGSNFILSSQVKSVNVTVLLNDVPVEVALDKVLTANDLKFQYDARSNIFFVTPQQAQVKKTATHVYPLKYATLPGAKLLSTISITDPNGGSSSSGTTASGTATSSGGDIVTALQSIIGEGGKIATDLRTNSLIITALEENFPVIESVIAKLDVSIPQVLIQVEMIDVSKGALQQMGVKYGTTFYNIQGLGGNDFLWPLSQKDALNNGAAKTTYTRGVMTGQAFSAALEFLTTKTDSKTLARPRLLTLNNETAQIQIATNQVIGVNSTNSGQGSTQVTTSTAERYETGVVLTVTPQVNLLSGEIMMAVSPKDIEVRDSAFTGFKDPETRGAKVMMRVRDGETIVLGGLLRSEKGVTSTKVPLLGDIPVLGRLFRHKQQNVTDRELVIFITPHILLPDAGDQSSKNFRVNTLDRETSGPQRSDAIQSDLDRADERMGYR